MARRLRGSLFEDPFAIDGGVTSASPRIDFAGKGIGGAVAAADGNAVFSAYLDKFNAFQAAARVDATPSSAAPAPVVATSERGDVYVAWRTGAGDGGDVRARRKDGEKGFEPEFVASDPAFGAVAPGQVAIGADRSGNTVVAMLQGSGAGARITAAVYDRAARQAGRAQLDPLPRPQAADQVGGRLGELGPADVHGPRRRQGPRHDDHERARLAARARQGRCTATR